jgi:hypothetical protein
VRLSDLRNQLDQDRAGDVTVVGKGGAVQVAGQIVQGVVAVGFVAIAVRILGTGDYGLFRQVTPDACHRLTAGTRGLQLFGDALHRKGACWGKPWSGYRVGMDRVRGWAITSIVVFIVLQTAADPLAARFADGMSQRDELAELIRPARKQFHSGGLLPAKAFMG